MISTKKILKIFSRLSFILAFLVPILKVMFQGEYKNMFTGNYPKSIFVALLLNLFFNIFIFLGVSVLFLSLREILENIDYLKNSNTHIE